MDLIYQGLVSSGSHSIRIPQGKYASFLLLFEGTAQAGETVAAADLGSLRLMVEARQVQYLPFSRLQSYNLLKGGIIDTTSGAGAAYSMSAFLPMAVPGDNGNVLDAQAGQRVFLEQENASGMAAKLSAADTLKVFGLHAEGVQVYLLKIGKYDMNLAAGTPTEELPAEFENIYEILLKNEGNLTTVLMKADGKTIINCVRAALIAQTHFINKLETWSASTPLLDLILSPTKTLQESLTDSVIFDFQTAAAISPLESIVICLDFTPDVAIRSKLSMGTFLEQKITRKLAEGKQRPVSALQLMQG